MKLQILFLACGALLLGSLGALLAPWLQPGSVAPGVTAAGIRRVAVGMTPTQVLAKLGRPYWFSSTKGSGTHLITCRDASAQLTVQVADTTDVTGLFRRAVADTAMHVCDRQDERKHDRRSTLTYTQPGGLLRDYPMLWIHFDRLGRVSEVYAREYAVDDPCIYSLSADAQQNFAADDALRRLFDSGR